ncbi:hypothetical protein EDD29_0543 [Actinocorallia herbida]|uniref:Uncharacterized protein n=1 Tax=Actinocorallia herbida TaxID=58109 RepID=A0A3N1CPG1_9ACTN|nr:hypothetical protein [Actinocorallia herbida]ROO83054.1 hypothetical protein EDD29_0543 [Actinocorallia herbida]
MRVEVASDAFTTGGFEDVVTLMRYFTEDRHDWVVDPRQLPAIECFFSEHTPSRASTYTRFARKASVSARAWTSSRRRERADTISVTADSLADHTADLGRSAKVVVENGDADRSFLLAVARVFGRERVIAAERKSWLEFTHSGGGGELPKRARHEAAGFRLLRRVVFVFDGDRMTPNERSKHEKVAADLRKDAIEGHILIRREVENYIPTKVLAAVKGRQSALTTRISLLKSLIPEQRAHIDIKNGFADKKTKQAVVPAAQAELFATLPPATVKGLREGFGEGLPQLLEREVEAGNVKESDFAALGSEVCEELKALLALIDRII